MAQDKLILLKRKNPDIYEIHRGSINVAHNLILTTRDKAFAYRLVAAYNDLWADKNYKNVKYCFCGSQWDGINCSSCGFDASEVDIY